MRGCNSELISAAHTCERWLALDPSIRRLAAEASDFSANLPEFKYNIDEHPAVFRTCRLLLTEIFTHLESSCLHSLPTEQIQNHAIDAFRHAAELLAVLARCVDTQLVTDWNYDLKDSELSREFIKNVQGIDTEDKTSETAPDRT